MEVENGRFNYRVIIDMLIKKLNTSWLMEEIELHIYWKLLNENDSHYALNLIISYRIGCQLWVRLSLSPNYSWSGSHNSLALLSSYQ